ncbi:MAG TPA: MATE family efflux transporter, partial [Verrucomicrobiae bacterium]|nr:MATE family efflux transporter [Verrucomicrobiae bacterium]
MESSVGRTIPRDQLRRNVLILAWPVCIEMILQMMLGIVDTAMVGKHGPAAIAAVGFGNTILTFVISVFAAITVGTTALVARHIGAGEDEDAAVVARQSLLLSLGLSAVITALGLFFAREGIRGMLVLQKDMDDAVISQGTAFIRLVSLTMIPGL